MEQHISVAFWSLAVGAVAVVVLLVRQWQITTRLRGRIAVLEGDQRLRDEEAQHLESVRLPALAESLYERPVEVPGPLHERLAGTAYAGSLDTVLSMFADCVEQAKDRADHSAKSTLKAMMRGVQSLANEQQLAISRMQDRHDDPDVLEDLLKIDHMNAQLGRRAQATAVLCGSWPGQQRSASSLTDVVRGATSRIRDYLRIQIHPHADVGVVSRVVEPVVLALAEVLDNAARHSRPNTSVEVDFRQAHNGIAIVVDDAGVAMNPEELQRAARLLSGRDSVDINRLGDPPRVGFAVVGVLAARYGFSVSVDTRSPYGGVRAVVFLPSVLLTRLDRPQAARPAPAVDPPADDRPVPGKAAAETMAAETMAAETMAVDTVAIAADPAAAVAGAPSPASGTAHEPSLTAGGLPRRRRVTAALRRPAEAGGHGTGPQSPPDEQPPAAGRSDAAAPPAGTPARPARQVAAGMGAWQRGTRSGRASGPPESEGRPRA